MRRRIFLTLTALAATSAPFLAGCRGGSRPGNDDGASGGGGTGSSAASATPAGFQELEAHIMGQRVAVRVSPLVRVSNDATALVVELTRASDDAAVGDVQASTEDHEDVVYAGIYLGEFPGGSGANHVRLIDTMSTGRVWTAGSASGSALRLKPGETVSSTVVFAPVDLDEVTVLVPQTGFVRVRVIERDAAADAEVSTEALAEADKIIRDENGPGDKAAVVPLERYTRTLDDSVGTRTTDRTIAVTLSSDVTFESDSYNLTGKADAQLQAVATQIAQHPDGGALDIVGHTDDVADDAHNQKLSEDRAAAVKDRLAQLTDLGKWQVTTTGKGESEPAVKDTTDEARAANRRVVTTITPTNGTQNGATPSSTPSAAPSSSSTPDGNLPESTGPTGKGPDGVTVPEPDGKGQVTFTLDHATRTGGLLLAQLTATTGPGGTGSTGLNMWLTDPLGPAITALTQSARGENGGMGAVEISEGLTLLADGQRVYPADYLPPGGDWHRPLTELSAADSLKEGAATTICVAWPDTGQDTLTLDHPPSKRNNDYAYRLTNIPVTEN